jgi:hypothetical protein
MAYYRAADTLACFIYSPTPPPPHSKNRAKLAHFGKKYFFFQTPAFPAKPGNDPVFSFFLPHYWFLSGPVAKTGKTDGSFVRQISRKEHNKMKRLIFSLWLPLFGAALILFSCDNPNSGGGNNNVPPSYQNFYNYPDGRKNASGTLEIRNSAASPVLLFTDSVAPVNYIGIADSLSTIKVRLPEEKFYTIVAVDKATWEERGDQASLFSDLTYYSNMQPYSMSVHASSAYGAGIWIINNTTNYWVAFRKSDQSGTTYAVAAPNARRMSVPIQLNTNYDFIPHFYKELKYNGKVIALVEYDDNRRADTVTTSEARRTFTTDIGNLAQPSINIKPAIYFTNNSDKTVRIYSGQNYQLGMGDDFAMASGMTEMLTGLEADTNTNSIQFASIAWETRVSVTENMIMQNNKVYRIVLAGNQTDNNYSTTVIEEDASMYFN